MEWAQMAFLILGNGALIIPLFLWTRAESRADIRHMEAKLEANRNETNSLIRSIQEDGNAFRAAIQLEMKDFHARLCELQAKSK